MKLTTSSPNFIKPVKWLALALVIKLILYFIFIFPDSTIYATRNFSGPFIRSNDHNEYIRPIDNLIEKGVYALDGSSESYAGRLPGFVFPYVIFRAMLSESTSNLLLGIFILALSIIASYVLALLLFSLTQKRWAFIAGFLLANFVPYFWHYEWTLHTSSLGISCLIFFLYYFHKYITDQNKNSLIRAGFFVCWLVFLRGFCFFYLPLILLFLFYLEIKLKTPFKKVLISFLVFLAPLFVFESVWITRNYISLNKFVPLQTSFVPGADSKNTEYGYQSSTKYSLTKVRELIFAWGGDNVWYFPNSDFSWFVWHGGRPNEHTFDESIFYAGLSLDTLQTLRSDVFYSYKDSLSQKQHDSIEDKIARTSIHLKEKFKSDRKIYYYFNAPLKKLKNYLFKNVTQDWPGPDYKTSNIFQKGIKGLSILEYYILLLQIIIFPFLYFKNKNKFKAFYLLLYALVLATIFPFLFVIPMAHYTYFIFGFASLIPIFVFNVNGLFFKEKE